MSLNPGGDQNYSWNYAHPDKPYYTKELMGTVVAIQEVQKREFSPNGQPGKPCFWPEGNPMMNQRIALATPDGRLVTFTYQPASKKQKQDGTGVHMALYALTGNTDMNNLVGKTIRIVTKDAGTDDGGNPIPGMPTRYGSGYPRPFSVFEVNGGPHLLNEPLPAEFTVPRVLCNEAASGGQVQQQGVAPQNIQVPQQPVSAQPAQQYVAPVQEVQPIVAQPVVQPVATQTVMQQQPETTINPMQPDVPAGMDPQIAAAMQGINGSGNETPSVYDPTMPF